MNHALRADGEQILRSALNVVQPDAAVRRTLQSFSPGGGRSLIVAIGKAAWQMARAAVDTLDQVDGGIVITKYGHSKGDIPGLLCLEAGHPVPDENSFSATRKALELTCGLSTDDTVIFLISGGGSALFELPLISGDELAHITRQLLARGADIVEINCIRKRLSMVKGGRFALHCAPARVLSIVLSDVLGDGLDSIASGPAYPDSCDSAMAKSIAEKYALELSDKARALLDVETPKTLDNVQTYINGSVRELCAAAAAAAAKLGYEPIYLTDRLSCEAREAGRFLSSIAQSHANSGKSLAFIAGGETVVHLTGSGLGGRNQELALAACEGIAGLKNAAVLSLGSDGTDGPTDAAGGYVDGDTLSALQGCRIELHEVLRDNDAYHALKAVGGLIITGPTGTNVNDVSIALLRSEKQTHIRTSSNIISAKLN